MEHWRNILVPCSVPELFAYWAQECTQCTHWLAVNSIQEILLIPSIPWNASSLCKVCPCWTSMEDLSGHLFTIFSELHCSQHNAIFPCLCPFQVFILRAEAASLCWTDCLWLMSLSTGSASLYSPRILGFIFPKLNVPKCTFSSAVHYLCYFGFCSGLFFGTAGGSDCPRHCYSTQHYYNLGTMCLKIKESKESSLYTLVFPWLSYFQS